MLVVGHSHLLYHEQISFSDLVAHFSRMSKLLSLFSLAASLPFAPSRRLLTQWKAVNPLLGAAARSASLKEEKSTFLQEEKTIPAGLRQRRTLYDARGLLSTSAKPLRAV
jgi:hypothetical protein